jgi:anti-sigma factor RsiW
MNCSEARIQTAGYVDGELSTQDSSRLSNHLSECPRCRRARSVQSFVSVEVRREASRFTASAALRRRVGAALRSKPAQRDSWWRNLLGPALAPAAGFAFATLLTGNVYLLATNPSKDERIAEDVLTSHVRALVSARPIDVVSSDRHTVKPWYTGKLDFSPPVTDFASEGFALAGGRLDYVDGRPVAALVYAHREHVIDVFVWPSSHSGSAPPAQLVRRGYNVVHSTQAGMNCWIASDLEMPDLMALERLLAASRAM